MTEWASTDEQIKEWASTWGLGVAHTAGTTALDATETSVAINGATALRGHGISHHSNSNSNNSTNSTNNTNSTTTPTPTPTPTTPTGGENICVPAMHGHRTAGSTS